MQLAPVPPYCSEQPLSDDQIGVMVPSIFADAAHASCSGRYSYIPTAAVLAELRKEDFQPFMVCQTRVRREDRRDHTKHMIRLRHASQINGTEANEIILLNSHDGSSSYQMLAVTKLVIEGAYEVLRGFGRAQASRDAMQAVASIRAKLKSSPALRCHSGTTTRPKSAPITEGQLLAPRCLGDQHNDLWSVFNCTQENFVQGGLSGRSANGRRQQTRPVQSIDQNVRLNRALWLLADGMQRLKA